MAPGIRPCDHREARAPRAAASTLGAPGSPVPESSCLGSPSRVPLLARSAGPARSSRDPPPRGQVPYWVRSGFRAGPPWSCSRESSARGSRPLPVGSPPLEPKRGAEARAGVLRRRRALPPRGSGCRRTAAGAASSRAAGSGTLPTLVGAAAADRGGGSQPPHLRGWRARGPVCRGRAQRRACGCRQEPPLGHLLAPLLPLEDVAGEAHVLPAGAEQDHLGGARTIPEPVPGGLGRLWLGVVSVAGPRVRGGVGGRGGASRVALHA